MKNSIKVERAKKNITQADLAILAKVSRQTINAMELGKYVPSTVLSLRLAQIFEVEVSQIFTLEDSDWDQEDTAQSVSLVCTIIYINIFRKERGEL